MKQTSKKMVSLLIALMMLVSMMTAVMVGAADYTGISELDLDFESASDMDFIQTHQVNASKTGIESGAGVDGSAGLRLQNGRGAGVNYTALCFMPNYGTKAQKFEFKKGVTYEVSFQVKGDSNALMDIYCYAADDGTYILNGENENKRDGYFFQVKESVPKEWTTYTKRFTVTDFVDKNSASLGIDSFLGTINVYLRPNGDNAIGSTDSIVLDNFVLKEVQKNAVTVKITGNGGTVTKDGNAVTNGQVYSVEQGSEMTLNVLANDGYTATVKNGAQTLTPDADGNVTFIVDVDTTIDVTFVANPISGNISLDFEEAGDMDFVQKHWVTGASGIASGAGVDGGSALKLVASRVSASGFDPLCMIPTAGQKYEFKKGATYELSFQTKGNTNLNINIGCSSADFGGYYIKDGERDNSQQYYIFNCTGSVTTDEWTTYTYRSTITDFVDKNLNSANVDSILAYITVQLQQTDSYTITPNSDTLYLDNVTLKEIYKNDVTVNITGDGGTVTKDGETVTSGQAYSVEQGSDMTLNVAPKEGYTVAVTQDGTTLTPNANNDVTFTVNGDSVISVTFTKKPEVPAGIANDASYKWFKMDEGIPTVFVFSKLNAFNVGENLEYGIYLWDQENEEEKVKLNAYDPATQKPAVAKANAMFAIRAYGDAIKVERKYGVQPFVGEETGSVMDVTFESENN